MQLSAGVCHTLQHHEMTALFAATATATLAILVSSSPHRYTLSRSLPQLHFNNHSATSYPATRDMSSHSVPEQHATSHSAHDCFKSLLPDPVIGGVGVTTLAIASAILTVLLALTICNSRILFADLYSPVLYHANRNPHKRRTTRLLDFVDICHGTTLKFTLVYLEAHRLIILAILLTTFFKLRDTGISEYHFRFAHKLACLGVYTDTFCYHLVWSSYYP